MPHQPIKSPDFTTFGYQVEQQLAAESHSFGSSFIWQAIAINNKDKVVIKELRFGSKDSSWQAYDSQKQELKLLQQLEHPRIPKYLTSFETETSFCTVREYLDGESLAVRSLSTEAEIIAVAVGVLEILRYLQQQEPPVWHLNLNPDNILRDQQNNVYLVGFQLAQNGSQQLAGSEISSAIALENAEFIPPEQLQQPLAATDIYGLGSTLQKLILLEPRSGIPYPRVTCCKIPHKINLPQTKPTAIALATPISFTLAGSESCANREYSTVTRVAV